MIDIERTNGIATLRMAHPPVNALDLDMLEALERAVADVADARGVVITGIDGVFSAGADLKAVLEAGPADRARGVEALGRAFTALFTFPRPMIAAINGHAIAGGAIIACACDRRIMARGSGVIGLAELAVGVPFPLPALEIVRFAIGAKGLQELIYFGDGLAPEDALARHLVDEVVEPGDVEPRATAVAERLAAIPAESFEHTKRILRRPVIDVLERHAAAADQTAARIWGSDAVTDSIRSFMDRLRAR